MHCKFELFVHRKSALCSIEIMQGHNLSRPVWKSALLLQIVVLSEDPKATWSFIGIDAFCAESERMSQTLCCLMKDAATATRSQAMAALAAFAEALEPLSHSASIENLHLLLSGGRLDFAERFCPSNICKLSSK